ncbi:hypothetical protein [Salibacter halophilus]|uniref:Uncharacterized protein n=1 Tax=Salibacter halophilus TaxID=1803916 RepID=A0A6N6M6Y3_9FLAO|nr:hypothetical protein [Salibacter halophilus]KAB1063489.1 hypothetical protein F3059_10505 [Salibacter halophilus]
MNKYLKVILIISISIIIISFGVGVYQMEGINQYYIEEDNNFNKNKLKTAYPLFSDSLFNELILVNSYKNKISEIHILETKKKSNLYFFSLENYSPVKVSNISVYDNYNYDDILINPNVTLSLDSNNINFIMKPEKEDVIIDSLILFMPPDNEYKSHNRSNDYLNLNFISDGFALSDDEYDVKLLIKTRNKKDFNVTFFNKKGKLLMVIILANNKENLSPLNTFKLK